VFAKPPEDMKLTAEEICDKYGFTYEWHEVTTIDGYILNVARISGQKSEEEPRRSGEVKPPIFLQHGILDSSDGWLCNGGKGSIPFILVREGYDVWLGNFRGNKYSGKHLRLDPDRDMEYWKYSWSEIAAVDIPAQLAFVKEKTGAPKVAYIGHSMGTTTMFYLMATNYA
jgi:lysosomal acid lipase/cholesteryl ester hydrolase